MGNLDSIKSAPSKSKLRDSKKDSKKKTPSVSTVYKSVKSNMSIESMILYNAELASLVNLNVIEPVPRYMNQRKTLEVINSAFMRACRLNDMTRGDHLDVNLTIKNITYIAEVLEKMSGQKSQTNKK